MSIWCSHPHIGTDPSNWLDESGQPIAKIAERGNVVSYASGFGNHYPDLTGTHERPAVVALADIPHWCVPGVSEGDYDEDSAGPWLRLEVVAPETLDFWTKNDDGSPTVVSDGATVVLDEEAVTSLRDDLTAWLERPKARTVEALKAETAVPAGLVSSAVAGGGR